MLNCVLAGWLNIPAVLYTNVRARTYTHTHIEAVRTSFTLVLLVLMARALRASSL